MLTYCVRAKGTDPRENLALEEYIINNCRQDEVWLYLWRNENTVVIGRNQNPWRECNMEAIKQDGVVLVRRQSGGGAVFHDGGNLNFTFIADKNLYDLEKQLKVVKSALKGFGLLVEFSGRNDILLDGKKFSGNAFSYKADVSMHHGTLLVSSDMTKLSHYLSPSKAKLQAKGVQSVRSRVCNLSDHADIDTETLMDALSRAFEAEYCKLSAEITSDDIDKSDYKELIEKYSSWEWTVGETPQYQMTFENRFDFGEVQLCLDVKNGLIQKAALFSDAMDAELILQAQTAIQDVSAKGEDIASAIEGSIKNKKDITDKLCSWVRQLM